MDARTDQMLIDLCRILRRLPDIFDAFLIGGSMRAKMEEIQSRVKKGREKEMGRVWISV